MANERVEIESGIEGLLAALKAAGNLAMVMSIGGQDYETILKAALGKAPFAVIKYVGKSGELQGGGLFHYSAEISVLIGAKSYKSLAAQRATIFDLLEGIEAALAGVRLGSGAGPDVYWPLVLAAEQWSEISGAGLEVWEQRYVVEWDELPV